MPTFQKHWSLNKNSSVLDIGSNQGFFCFQSVIHGAKKVVGIEKTLEDYQTAVDINDKIFKFDEVEFINGDAKKYVIETEEKFDVVVMNSVFHQLYPNMENGGDGIFAAAKLLNQVPVFRDRKIGYGETLVAIELQKN